MLFFFLLFSDKQQRNISVLPKLLWSRWWQILYCRGLLLTFNDIPNITSVFQMLQSSSFFQKKVLNQILCLVALRRVEDKQVAIKLLELWPNMVKMINRWECLRKWKRSSSKSYEIILTAVNDDLIPAKMHLFSFIACLFVSFLLEY